MRLVGGVGRVGVVVLSRIGIFEFVLKLYDKALHCGRVFGIVDGHETWRHFVKPRAFGLPRIAVVRRQSCHGGEGFLRCGLVVFVLAKFLALENCPGMEF